MMGKAPPGVLMFLLVVLKMLGTAEAACSCSSSVCDFSSLNLTCVPHVLGLPTDIKICDCSSQNLTSVPQHLPTDITHLYLWSNQIATISQSDFSRYRSLEILYLHDNHISIINSKAFYHLSNLTGLSLFQNRLESLRADMFTGLGNLQKLMLSNNSIADIQGGTFKPTPQLRMLFLDYNKLTTLRADMFTGLANLGDMGLSYNNITDIQAGTFNPTPGLKFLFLSYNRIQSIPPNLFRNLLLLNINLDNNNIKMFPFEDLQLSIQTSPYLSLSLQSNQLTSLPISSYDILKSIYDINIDNNPWQCCRMVDMRFKMTGSYPFENQITCSQPDIIHGQKLIDISPEDLMSYCEDTPIVIKA
ncbi:PREDICTED: SLIT and NTRK-like protein 5 [Branchiostoma belcheri]|uniref:SLIT and NTRK-like protein 5 n=1 Tax=Branchiostoma belcheri TaxID=7741 RepID=A0A6P4Y216_BRABE|nr:PREDICTED: SLIT and NTRK-like protein 5 [Branchiostoma belcheri]